MADAGRVDRAGRPIAQRPKSASRSIPATANSTSVPKSGTEKVLHGGDESDARAQMLAAMGQRRGDGRAQIAMRVASCH